MSKRNQRNRRNLPQAQNQQTTIVASRQQVRIAPLPTPEELAQFDQVIPGLAERIVRMAEQNGDDRRKNNRAIRVVTILGQVFAFVVVMSALLGGFYLAYIGRNLAGVAAIITAIAAPLGVFIYQRAKS